MLIVLSTLKLETYKFRVFVLKHDKLDNLTFIEHNINKPSVYCASITEPLL